MSKKNPPYWVVSAIVFIIVIVVTVIVIAQAVECVSSGGSYVKAFPWWVCIK